MSDPVATKYNQVMMTLFRSLEKPFHESQQILDRIFSRLELDVIPPGPMKPAASEKGRAFFQAVNDVERVSAQLAAIEEFLYDPSPALKRGTSEDLMNSRVENELDSLLDDITSRPAAGVFGGGRVLKPSEAPSTEIDYSKPMPEYRAVSFGETEDVATAGTSPTASTPDIPPELLREQELIKQGRFTPTPVAKPPPAATTPPPQITDDDPDDPAPPKPKPLSFTGMPLNAEQEAEFKEYQISKYEYETWENRQIFKKKKKAGNG